MRVLTEADGFPSLGMANIGIIKRPGAPSSLVDALCAHIFASLDNITPNGPQDHLRAQKPNIKLPNNMQEKALSTSSISW